jgi:type III secretion system YscI/HrpB-like protein
MSYGIEAANSFLTTVQPNSLVEPPRQRYDALGQSLSVRNFQDMLHAAQAEGVTPVQLAQVDPATGATTTDVVPPLLSAPGTPPVAEATPGADVDSRLRAAEGLGLDADAPAGPGNSILNGLEQLRASFDSQYNAVGSKLQGTTLDVTAMMQLQADIVKYSVLVDVSSKLAGKVTTSIDSLMKGQ